MSALAVERLEVPRENELVVLLLHGGELDADDELGLGGHVLEHVGLEAAEHVRPEEVVQLLHLNRGEGKSFVYRVAICKIR